MGIMTGPDIEEEVDEDDEGHAVLRRWLFLQEEGRHRILFSLYFCLLICCCVGPFVYYLRLYLWHRVRLRRLRQLEHAGLMAIIQQTMLNDHNRRGGDGEAATTVQEERKARIQQMMEPVRKVLKFTDFREVDHSNNPVHRLTNKDPSPAAAVVVGSSISIVANSKTTNIKRGKDPLSVARDETSTSCAEDTTDGFVDEEEEEDDDDDDEENDRLQIRVPPPGIVFQHPQQPQQQQQQQQQQSQQQSQPAPPAVASSPWLLSGPALPVVAARVDEPERWVPASCSICISSYEPKSTVVWSSNAQCPHVFHSSCMEMWLLKQQDEPICPCCRREFLVDPYDLLEEETMEGGGTAASTAETAIGNGDGNAVATENANSDGGGVDAASGVARADPPADDRRHMAETTNTTTITDAGAVVGTCNGCTSDSELEATPPAPSDGTRERDKDHGGGNHLTGM